MFVFKGHYNQRYVKHSPDDPPEVRTSWADSLDEAKVFYSIGEATMWLQKYAQKLARGGDYSWDHLNRLDIVEIERLEEKRIFS